MDKDKPLSCAEFSAIIYNAYLSSPDSKIMSIWEFLDKEFARERIEDDNYDTVL